MDVRSIEGTAPSIEHEGTVPVWWLFNPREMYDQTVGGHLELVSEFEIKGGGKVNPHSHPTFESYYVTYGQGIRANRGRGPSGGPDQDSAGRSPQHVAHVR